jgi:putative ABC transport system permease protein
MQTLLQDIRYGIRMLLKNPGFTAVAVLALTLGIGANTAIFSVLNSVSIRPLPYREPQRLLMVWESWKNQGSAPVAWPTFLDWHAQNDVFDAIAGYSWGEALSLTGANEPEQVPWLSTATSFFAVIGVEAMINRTFSGGDEKPGSEPVVVVSHGLWQKVSFLLSTGSGFKSACFSK